MRNVTVQEFGAVGDGCTDDTSALQRALDSGAERVVLPAGGCYLIRRVLEPAQGQCVVVDGTLKVADAERSPLGRDVVPGESRVVVEDASRFQVDDTISIHDDRLPIQGGGRKVRRERAGHARVVAISGNTLELDRAAFRSFSVAANGFVSRQNGAIWIKHSGVRICGTGRLEGNWPNQLNAAPGYLDEKVSETHPAASGITVWGQGWIDRVVIEGITIAHFTLMGISMRQVEMSVIRQVSIEAVHDKGIILWGCRDCRVTGNICRDSIFEDGIMLHQVYDGQQACRRIFIEGNTCRNNARYGIHIGGGHREIHLANNLCADNGLNLSIYGSYCTSTGDVASGMTDRLFLAAVYRPNVLLAGDHLSVSQLSAFGTRFVGVEICGQQIRLEGGLVGEMDAPVSCGEPGALKPALGEWGRGSGEFFIDGECGVGIAVIPGLTCRGQPNVPADITLAEVRVSGCRVGLQASPEAQKTSAGQLRVVETRP